MTMHESGKSDRSIVPENLPNKGRGAPRPAEEGEGRGRAKGSPGRQNRDRAQDRAALQSALDRIRQVAKQDKELSFTTLWHHIYKVDHLRATFYGLKREAAPGVDGETWAAYEGDLETNLTDLSDRLKRGAYRAKPVRRTWIPKPDGRQRPIGIPTLEDKLVQRLTAEVLGAVYEQDFLGFSYGFRPGRSQHNALDAVYVGITRRKVGWVLDMDIRGFFDAIDHEWLMKFVEHRIADRRVQRHIKKWLNAGVLEEGEYSRSERGTPQGGSISPLLANIYLHYVFDLWAHAWRKQVAEGDVIIVRYADDIVVGFQRRHDAERFHTEVEARMAQFGLSLSNKKTRLLEFGRFAAKSRQKRGEGKPETFDFLGFTHICGKSRAGKYRLVRYTIRARMTKTLHRIKTVLRQRMHAPVPEVGAWLARVLAGYYRYFAVPGNSRRLQSFRHAVYRMWWQVLRRRSHKARPSARYMTALTNRWLPRPRTLHPYPSERLRV
jgi:group II intron reverse transcriptase/maturase